MTTRTYGIASLHHSPGITPGRNRQEATMNQNSQTYVIETADGILMWIGDAESGLDAGAQHLAGIHEDPEDYEITETEIAKRGSLGDGLRIDVDFGEVLARVERTDSGTMAIYDSADDVEHAGDVVDAGYRLDRVELLTGWGVWRSLWRYVDEDGIDHLVARTLGA